MPAQATPVTVEGGINLTFLDIAGQTARTGIGNLTAAPTGPQVSALAAALGNASNAAVTVITVNTITLDKLANRQVFDEAHSRVVDKAVFIFQNDARQTRKVELPAPDASIFGSDGQTIDPTNALAAAIISAALAIYGGTFAYTRGFLSQRSRKVRSVTAPPVPSEPGVGDNPPALPAP